MATKTWAGGDSWADAGTAADWSPAGAPQPGDDLRMYSGSMLVTGNDLAGDTLTVASQSQAAPTTQNIIMFDGSSANISLPLYGKSQLNMAFAPGNETLNLHGDTGSGSAQAALAPGAVVSGSDTFAWSGAAFTGAGATMMNTGASGVSGGNVTIGPKLDGGGYWQVTSASGTPGTLELQGAIGSQGFYVAGDPQKLSPGRLTSKLVIDHPDQAPNLAATLTGASEIDLQGLHATSYSYQNNVLRLYDGSNNVDNVVLAVGQTFVPGLQLQVFNTDQGVAIQNSLPPPNPRPTVPQTAPGQDQLQAQGQQVGVYTPSPTTPQQSESNAFFNWAVQDNIHLGEDLASPTVDANVIYASLYQKSLMDFAHNFPNGDALASANQALFTDLSPGGGDATKVATDLTNIVAATDNSLGANANGLVFAVDFGAMGLAVLGQPGQPVYGGFGGSVGSTMGALSGPQLQSFATSLAAQISGTLHA